MSGARLDFSEVAGNSMSINVSKNMDPCIPNSKPTSDNTSEGTPTKLEGKINRKVLAQDYTFT